jgi:hypothetical protein
MIGNWRATYGKVIGNYRIDRRMRNEGLKRDMDEACIITLEVFHCFLFSLFA